MIKGFGSQINQFSLSVDIVNEETLRSFYGLIESFIREKLQISFYEILAKTKGKDNKFYLKSIWGSYEEEEGPSPFFQESDGKKRYHGQTPYAFETGKPLWIIGDGKKPLPEATEYVDLWSSQKDIPEYWHYEKNDIIPRTSIILPIKNSKNQIWGVINLESEVCLKPSPYIKKELNYICAAINNFFQLSEHHKIRARNTWLAVENLREVVASRISIGSIPSVFIASPSTADEEVMGEVLEVLDLFSNHFEVVNWKDIEMSGNINLQIIKAISAASIGVCYFSEKVENSSGDINYRDNPNVLFEAGMLHALTNIPVNAPVSWIPIREQSEGNIPFDFASERILIVPRYKNNKLNREKLRSELSKRIKGILK
jgi:hypothetical protein